MQVWRASGETLFIKLKQRGTEQQQLLALRCLEDDAATKIDSVARWMHESKVCSGPGPVSYTCYRGLSCVCINASSCTKFTMHDVDVDAVQHLFFLF